MSLHIVIGFDKPGCKGTPKCVYAGRSATEARAAREADTKHASFECFSNVIGVRKANSAYVAEAPEAEAPEAEAPEAEASERKNRGRRK